IAMQAVVTAVMQMEDNPICSAATGSTLNCVVAAETDEGIMEGKTRRGTGVALLRRVKNQVSFARVVMEKTDHAMLAGNNAESLAAAFGLPRTNLRVPERVSQWKQARRQLESGTLGHFSKNMRVI